MFYVQCGKMFYVQCGIMLYVQCGKMLPQQSQYLVQKWVHVAQ